MAERFNLPGTECPVENEHLLLEDRNTALYMCVL
jgi:hypothetical protein